LTTVDHHRPDQDIIMGIRFIDSILSLVAATFGVLTAYFFGHGLSEMTAWPWIASGLSLLVAVGLGWVVVRRVRGYQGHGPA
jgi:divalent metal cation (Fe/Co/Zn/Cd) transporter